MLLLWLQKLLLVHQLWQLQLLLYLVWIKTTTTPICHTPPTVMRTTTEEFCVFNCIFESILGRLIFGLK